MQKAAVFMFSVAFLLGSLGSTITLATPARADDHFAKACEFYKAQNYAQAVPLLAETVKNYPKFWPAHYYLGNTYLTQGKRLAARKEYESCLTCEPAPDAKTLSSCQKVIISLGGTLVDPTSAEAPAPAADPKAPPVGDKIASAIVGKNDAPTETLQEKEKRWHVERLRKILADRILVIKEEEKQGVVAATYKWVLDPDTNMKKLVTDADEEERVHADAAARIKKLQEDSDREIAAIH